MHPPGGTIGRTDRESTPSWPEPSRPAAGAPNVVMIVLDDVGFADLGCYGSEIATPHMDRLANAGLQYTNFHTTAMCSPTRASLLTGRMAHAVGMGIIAEWSTELPGYTGRVSPHAATLPEVLGEHGYNTLAVGKWHLMPQADATSAGPFRDWPLGRGFEHWYGFHGALADQWHPELFEDNHTVEPPEDPAGYHLSEDLVDHAIGYVRDQKANAPDRPLLLYLALGACHWPHHVPREYVERYRGRYERGWDVVRAERLARQKALRVVPPDCELAPRNPGVQAWGELSSDQRRLYARMQEVYAAFVEHTDAQIGRLLAYVERIGELQNTLLILLSDNGASPEGGAAGAANARKHLVYERETLERTLAAIDDLGSERAYNHYPTGWAQASNTPLKWYKKDVHGGGVRDPLIVHWPARLGRPGLRGQYHHVADVMPTVLEVLGVPMPSLYRGAAQMPLHGVSMAYSFDAPDAPTRKQTQYFELLGDRGLWHRGWKAVARHEPGADFERDRWELYHLEADFSETRDLAATHPDKLRELVERWWAEAGAYHVLPLDDREYERAAAGVAARSRRVTVLYPGMARLDRYHVPDITNRSYAVVAEIQSLPAGAEGVLLSVGSRFGGFVLYVQGGRLVHEYVYDERTRYVLRSADPLPYGGPCSVAFAFHKTGPSRGTGSLLVNGREVGRHELPKTWPVVGLAGGLRCGRDGGSPVSDAYRLPFAFAGILERVVVELVDDGQADPTSEARSALGEQ